MNNKRIAVLMSAYNGEKYIEEQIKSILNQRCEASITLIIRNDGSSDSTKDILDRISLENANIEVEDGKNLGLVCSFMELLKYACRKEYDYYSFSDQDDYWFPDKLDIAIKAIERFSDEPYLYASCSEIADEDLNRTGSLTQTNTRGITLYNSAIQNFCPGHNQVMNQKMADLIVQNTQYSKEIYSQDLWITNVAAVSGSIIFDNTPHTLYRQHRDNQLSFGKSKRGWIREHLRRLDKGEGKKMMRQLRYFVTSYEEFMTNEQLTEMKKFIESSDSFTKRARYIIHSKLYRQKWYETPAFKLIYLFGGYTI